MSIDWRYRLGPVDTEHKQNVNAVNYAAMALIMQLFNYI